MSLAHSLVRRGVGYTTQRLRDEERPIIISTPAIVLFAVTCFAYVVLSAAIDYTYGHLVATLAILETPTATAITRTPSYGAEETDDPDAPLLSVDEKADKKMVEQEVLLVSNAPITGRLCSTIRHLRERAGWFSRFRGVQIMVVYGLLRSLLTDGFSPLPSFIWQVMVSVLLCRLAMAWTHHVISEPGKKWYHRLGRDKGRLFRKIVLPTVAVSVAQRVACCAPMYMLSLAVDSVARLNISELRELDGHARFRIAALLVGAVVLFVVLLLFLVVPLHIALIRVQASLLPEDDETIVPFDRSFGGKVVPEIVGGKGKISMRDAWKTFDWNACVRLLKIWTKTLAMQFGLFLVFVTVVLCEAKYTIGDQVHDFFRDSVIVPGQGL